MEGTNTEKTTRSAKWVIDLFRPSDAPGVARLFRSYYGEGYPIKAYTTPEKLIEENEAGRIISVVARTPDDDIVAHMAFYRVAPFGGLYEIGANLVRSEYRGGMLAIRLAQFVHSVPARFPMDGYYSESACHQIVVQKIASKFGCAACALAVDLMPAEAYEMDEGVAGRVAGLADFKVLRPKAQTVYLPQAYESELRELYDGFEDGCRIDTGSGTIPRGLKSRVESTVLDFAKLAKHCVYEAGEDFGEAIDAAEAESAGRGCVIHHVVLKLSHPWTGQLVDMLRSRGYFFGGLLPRWFDDDGFLMQKTKDTPNWDGIVLFSERAKRIGEIARADWAGIPKRTGGK